MNFIGSIYFSNRFYKLLLTIIVIFILGYIYPLLFTAGKILLYLVLGFTIADMVLLYARSGSVNAARITGEKLSNGDINEIGIRIRNNYAFPVLAQVIDEVPYQFQIRDLMLRAELKPGMEKYLRYELRPVYRGEYDFGRIIVFVSSKIFLVNRRYIFAEESKIPVYPSFLQLKKFELIAFSNNLLESGLKKTRKIGHTMEFDQIREYVHGDDLRSINWRATARQRSLMVNQYDDEKSQQIYSIIDMGRSMKMPFDSMTLLDYAINAALVISNTALRKNDKAGVITFSKEMGAMLPADRRKIQLYRIKQTLYRQETDFAESDYELLYASLRHKIRTRSLIFLFTNFETLSALRRQIIFFKGVARSHLLIVIFFKNTELTAIKSQTARLTEDIYIQTIAEKFEFEKRQIVHELDRLGIQSILTTPQNLTIHTINKYLELKARGMI